MSFGVSCRHRLDPMLLWLWHRMAAAAPIPPLAWELPYAKDTTKKKKKKKKAEWEKRKQGCWHELGARDAGKFSGGGIRASAQ